jgi:hypothetical protein
MTDPTTWNAGDFHRWERPASPPCPHCVCCSAALCTLAIAKKSACHHEGSGASAYDLADCPCWRRDSEAQRAFAYDESVADRRADLDPNRDEIEADSRADEQERADARAFERQLDALSGRQQESDR